MCGTWALLDGAALGVVIPCRAGTRDKCHAKIETIPVMTPDLQATKQFLTAPVPVPASAVPAMDTLRNAVRASESPIGVSI